MTPQNYIVKNIRKVHHKNVIYFEEYYNSILKRNPLIDGFYLKKSCGKNRKAEDKCHFKIKLQQSSETNNPKLVTFTIFTLFRGRSEEEECEFVKCFIRE